MPLSWHLAAVWWNVLVNVWYCQGSVPESGFLVLQILNLSHELIHCGKNPFLLHRIVGLFQLQNNIFFVILQFLCNFLQDLPAKSCFSFRILHIASTVPFERDRSIGSPVRAPFSGIQKLSASYTKEQNQHLAFPILCRPIQTALQILLLSCIFALAGLIGFPFREAMKVSLFGQNPFPFHSGILHTLQFSISFSFRQRFPET